MQKKTVSKEEEEKLAREHYLKQQQLEREMMIREQQRQIESLKQLQKEQEANLTTAVKKNIPVKEVIFICIIWKISLAVVLSIKL